MNAYTDLHVHSTFSDGKATPEAIVKAAIARGMVCVGISDHSYTDFDTRYCMKKTAFPAYREELARLKEAYAGQIRVLCGIEQDYWSDAPAAGLDYVIGSVHYVKCGENDFSPVDSGASAAVGIGFLRQAAQRLGGDLYDVMELYYRTVADVPRKTGADIIGHFDLITKFNDGGALFDEDSPRYKKAATDAADALLAYDIPFEINTGAIARSFKQTPYPAPKLIDYIRARGGRFILSGDAHTPENLCFAFDAYERFLVG